MSPRTGGSFGNCPPSRPTRETLVLGAYIPGSGKSKERHLGFILDLIYIIGAIVIAGAVAVMLSKF